LSNLFVDKISGKSGTSSGAPITLSGDTATLGSGVDINTSLATATFPTGHVIQVVSNRIDQDYEDYSTVYKLVTAHTLNITPSSTSSKVLVMIGFCCRGWGTKVTYYTIFRDGTNLGPASGLATFHDDNASSDNEQHTTLTFLDSPNTTSPTAYKLYGKADTPGGCRVNKKGSASVITLMEIAG
jgi:hypothetical protein